MSQAGSANSSSSKKRARRRRARITWRTVSSSTDGASPPWAGASLRLAAGVPGPTESRARVAAIRLTSSDNWRRRTALGSDTTSCSRATAPLLAVASANAVTRSAGVASTSKSTLAPDSRAEMGSISAAGAATMAGKRPLAASASTRSSSRSSGAPASESTSTQTALAAAWIASRSAASSIVTNAARYPAASTAAAAFPMQ